MSKVVMSLRLDEKAHKILIDSADAARVKPSTLASVLLERAVLKQGNADPIQQILADIQRRVLEIHLKTFAGMSPEQKARVAEAAKKFQRDWEDG